MAQLSDEQLHSLYDEEDLSNLFFTWQIGNKGSKADFTREYINEHYLHVQSSAKVLALMLHTGSNWVEANEYLENGEYLVYTKEEADEGALEIAVAYIDYAIGDIADGYQQYFNREEAVEHYLEEHTNGELLSSYNNTEYEEVVNDITYYIYRQ